MAFVSDEPGSGQQVPRDHALHHLQYRRDQLGLPNILSREFVVPELIQQDCTPEALVAAVLTAFDDRAAADRIGARFRDIHQQLRCDTASRATDAVAQALAA